MKYLSFCLHKKKPMSLYHSPLQKNIIVRSSSRSNSQRSSHIFSNSSVIDELCWISNLACLHSQQTVHIVLSMSTLSGYEISSTLYFSFGSNCFCLYVPSVGAKFFSMLFLILLMSILFTTYVTYTHYYIILPDQRVLSIGCNESKQCLWNHILVILNQPTYGMQVGGLVWYITHRSPM